MRVMFRFGVSDTKIVEEGQTNDSHGVISTALVDIFKLPQEVATLIIKNSEYMLWDDAIKELLCAGERYEDLANMVANCHKTESSPASLIKQIYGMIKGRIWLLDTFKNADHT